MNKLVLGLGLLLAGGAMALAQDMRPPINADDVKWGPVPPNLPAGAQLAVISGDPFKEGLYVIRLKMPADYKVPAHYHPRYENVTVLSGEFNVGMGDKLDTTKGMALRHVRVALLKPPPRCTTLVGRPVIQSFRLPVRGRLASPTSIRRTTRVRSSNAVVRELGPGPICIGDGTGTFCGNRFDRLLDACESLLHGDTPTERAPRPRRPPTSELVADAKNLLIVTKTG
jgi:hypothetical protein